jgi:ferric-dicitrate binding protein FerR (iron transport regulator)
VPVSAAATSTACPRGVARTAHRPASRSARRWLAGSVVLAALAALALFWLLVKPLTLQAGALGLNHVQTSARVGTPGMPTRRQIAPLAAAG